MNIYSKHNHGFTLIEVLVSITIFSIIMVSVMMIFISATQVSARIDINRAMQENTKNITEMIAKDVLDYGISGVSSLDGTDCSLSGVDLYSFGDKLCLGKYNYFLALATSGDSWDRIGYGEIGDKCSDITSECVLVRRDIDAGTITRASNSQIYFRDLRFSVSNTNIPKVTINFTLQPSAKKGVKPDLIKKSKIIFQTTLSERLIKTN